MLANHLGHPLTDPLRHLERVRRDPAELAILPDRYGCFLEARIKWIGPYLYPPEARDNFRGYVVVSTPPGTAPDPFMAPIESDAERAGIRVVDRYSSGATTASPYFTASGEHRSLSRPDPAGDGGPLSRNPLRTGADLRCGHDIDLFPPERDRGLRILADTRQHHGFGATAPQRRANLSPRLCRWSRSVSRHAAGIRFLRSQQNVMRRRAESDIFRHRSMNALTLTR